MTSIILNMFDANPAIALLEVSLNLRKFYFWSHTSHSPIVNWTQPSQTIKVHLKCFNFISQWLSVSVTIKRWNIFQVSFTSSDPDNKCLFLFFKNLINLTWTNVNWQWSLQIFDVASWLSRSIECWLWSDLMWTQLKVFS